MTQPNQITPGGIFASTIDMRHFSIIDPELPPGPPLGYQITAVACLRAYVEAEFRRLGVKTILSGSHIDGEDLRLYIPSSGNGMLIRFVPHRSGPRVQFYLPLKALPGHRESARLAAESAPETKLVLAKSAGAPPVAVAEFTWRGNAEDLIEHLGKIGTDLKAFIDIPYKPSSEDSF